MRESKVRKFTGLNEGKITQSFVFRNKEKVLVVVVMVVVVLVVVLERIRSRNVQDDDE